MDREAKAVKERKCKECGQAYFMAARELRDHAAVCKRVTAAGLIMPTVVAPKVELVKLYD